MQDENHRRAEMHGRLRVGGKGAANPPGDETGVGLYAGNLINSIYGSGCLHFGGVGFGNAGGTLFMQELIDDYILPWQEPVTPVRAAGLALLSPGEHVSAGNSLFLVATGSWSA